MYVQMWKGATYIEHRENVVFVRMEYILLFNQTGKLYLFPGKPNKANITSRTLSFYSDRYNLTWSVFSYSEVIKFRILYRKVIVSCISFLYFMHDNVCSRKTEQTNE